MKKLSKFAGSFPSFELKPVDGTFFLLFCQKKRVLSVASTPKSTRLKAVFSLMLSSTKRFLISEVTKKLILKNIFSKQNTSNFVWEKQKVEKPLPFDLTCFASQPSLLYYSLQKLKMFWLVPLFFFFCLVTLAILSKMDCIFINSSFLPFSTTWR